jgi:uncharacterized membrane protein YdjX (TVP38/TMEM64 family)
LTPPVDPPAASSKLRRWLPLAALAMLALLVVATGAHRWLSLETIALHKGRLESFVDTNILLALPVFMAVYVAVVALSIPGALLMTIVGGLFFPFWIAVLAVVTAATLGATILFLIASSSLGEALRAKGGPTVARMTDGLKADAASYMLFLRLVPVFPFALVNLAPAIVGVPLRTFVWTTFLGILPGTMAFILAAAQPDCRINIDISALVSPQLLLAFAALGVIALIPVIARRIFARRGKTIA